MQAVIMAGGKGTRLSSVTQDLIPKALVPFCGKPLIERAIDQLVASGIRDIYICTGVFGDQIEVYFAAHPAENAQLHFIWEEKPLGTAGPLANLREFISEDFVFVYGDLIFDISLDRMYAFHRAKSAAITLFAHPNDHPADSDLLICDHFSRVSGFAFKGTDRAEDQENLANAGLMILSPSIFHYILKPEKVSLEKDLLPKVIKAGEPVFAYRSPEYIKDAGTPLRLDETQRDWYSGKIKARNLAKKQKAIFLDRDGTINEFVGLVTAPDQIKLIPGAAEAIRLINRSDYLAIIVTNQPVVARGDCSFANLYRIHKRLQTLLGNEGAYIDDLLFCPHHPDRGFIGEIPELKIVCTCRKPQPGMLMSAAEKYNIALSGSWMIGDSQRDIQTGINAGTRTALVHSIATDDPMDAVPDIVCSDLYEAVKIILKESCVE